MNRKILELLEQTLRLFGDLELKKFNKLIWYLSFCEKIPSDCNCEEFKYCECVNCEEHRNKSPFLRSWKSSIIVKEVKEVLYYCNCEICEKHRKLDNLKCYACTNIKTVQKLTKNFRDIFDEIFHNIVFAHDRMKRDLENWERRKRLQWIEQKRTYIQNKREEDINDKSED